MSWREILGLEVTLGHPPQPNAAKQPVHQDAGLLEQAIVKYTGAAISGTGGSAIMKMAATLGMLPDVEEYKAARQSVPKGLPGAAWAVTHPRRSIPMTITHAMWGTESTIEKNLDRELRPFTHGVQQAVNRGAQSRGNFELVYQLGREVFGISGTRQLLEASEIAQQDKGDIRPVEIEFAKKLALVQRTQSGVNPTGWIAEKSRQLLQGIVADGGSRQVSRDEFLEITRLLGMVDEKDGLEIARVSLWNTFWASAFQGIKSLNPEVMLGKGGVTIKMNGKGEIVRVIGYEEQLLANNASQLTTKTIWPDWVEAVKGMNDGQMNIPVASRFVKSQMRKGDDPNGNFRDVGTVELGRAGASGRDTVVTIPTVSVSGLLKTLRSGIEAMSTATGRITAIRTELPAVGADPDEFKGAVIEDLTQAVLHQMPRKRMVTEVVRQLEDGARASRQAEIEVLRAAGLPVEVEMKLANAIVDQTAEQRQRAVDRLTGRLNDETKAEEAMQAMERMARLKTGRI